MSEEPGKKADERDGAIDSAVAAPAFKSEALEVNKNGV